jgi:hypothetical protein
MHDLIQKLDHQEAIAWVGGGNLGYTPEDRSQPLPTVPGSEVKLTPKQETIAKIVARPCSKHLSARALDKLDQDFLAMLDLKTELVQEIMDKGLNEGKTAKVLLQSQVKALEKMLSAES